MKVVAEGFAGFRPAAFAFFSELQDNNDPRKERQRNRSTRILKFSMAFLRTR